MDSDVPFPQADDFDKLIRIINARNEHLLNENFYIRECIGFVKDRQVSYYLSALMYLKILDKNKKFTSLGSKIRKLNIEEQKKFLIELMLKDKIINEVYNKRKKQKNIVINDIIPYIKDAYPLYSEAVYKRRAHTINKWVDWILNNEED